MQSRETRQDLTRTTLGVLFLLALMGTSLWILRPFLSAALWATMLVIATWPVLLRLQSALGGRRSLAAGVLTLALLAIVIVPLGEALALLVGNMDAIRAWVNLLQNSGLPAPPAWLSGIPIAGPRLAETWLALASAGPEGLAARIHPYLGAVLEWVASQTGSIGTMILHFLLTVVISAILYMKGEAAGSGVRRFATRLAGARGDQVTLLAAGAIRGVALGVVVTALAQTLVAGAGLVIASIPGAALLASVILVLCLVQLGPTLVMLPVVIWKYYQGDTISASVLLVFAVVAGGMDNFVRPVLIRRGADLPLLLILAGVLGGLVSFGIMGIFVGPVVLAVTYTLLCDWVENRPEPEGGGL